MLSRDYYAVVDKEGCGWDMKIGKVIFPIVFLTAENAQEYKALAEAQYKIVLYVVPATLQYQKPYGDQKIPNHLQRQGQDSGDKGNTKRPRKTKTTLPGKTKKNRSKTQS